MSDLLTGQRLESEDDHDSRPAAQNSHNRFANTLLGDIPVPFPKNYLLGIDIQQRDFEQYGRPSYLCGQWQDHGWWYYYLYAGLIKIPLGTLLLGGIALALGLQRWVSFQRSGTRMLCAARDTLFLLAPPLVIFCVVSSKTGFSEHFRYVLPTFPFLFIWIGSNLGSRHGVLKVNRDCVDSSFGSETIEGKLVVSRLGKSSFVFSTLILWSVTSSLWVYPHSLSYFNELIGGPLRGPEHLLGSNVDWGQDLRYAKTWFDSQDRRNGSVQCHLAYSGNFNPADVGFESATSVDFDKKNPAKLKSGWYLTGINFVKGARWRARDGNRDPTAPTPVTIQAFEERKPVLNMGYSMWVYLEEE